jgi:hypothetical protein
VVEKGTGGLLPPPISEEVTTEKVFLSNFSQKDNTGKLRILYVLNSSVQASNALILMVFWWDCLGLNVKSPVDVL